MSLSSPRVSPRSLLACLLGLAMAVWALPAAAETVDLASSAGKGQFDVVLEELQTLPANRHSKDLIKDLERYESHKARDLSTRNDGLAEALKEMSEHVQADELDKALYSAEEARSLAVDKEAMLARPEIISLVAKTRKAAVDAEAAGRWLDALNLYRGLDVLYKINATYHDDVKRVTNRVRVLRIYAPDVLQDLYEARAKRMGEEDVEPLKLDKETWKNRLEQLEWGMMKHALDRAARFHIDANGYKPMMVGGFDALIEISQTVELRDVDGFEGLNNAPDRKAFEDSLEGLKRTLDNAGEIGPRDVERYMIALRSINKDTVNLPEKVIVYEVTEGATGTLDDYSTVIWPHDLPDLLRTLQGNFPGVGILLSRSDGKLLVKSPLENGPAIRGGIRAGDVIAAVEGKPTEDWTLDKAVENITGPEGTEVTLTIERGHKLTIPVIGSEAEDDLLGKPKKKENKDDEEPNPDIKSFDVTLKRASINIGSVLGWERLDDQGNWDYLVDKEWRIGYVRLTQFLPQTAEDLDRAVHQMTKDGPINGLIVDLRFNPGGLLRAAVHVSDRFINKGTIVSTVDKSRNEQEKHVAKRDTTYPNFPVVVLVNQGSASASEIVSGAVQAYDRATIVGMRSFGKGSVQDMFNLPGGRALLKLTTQYYRLPNNRIIHRKPRATTWGIEPDLIVDITDQQVRDQVIFRGEIDVLHVPDEMKDPNRPWPKATEIFEKGLDPQLEAGLLLLKTRQFAAERANHKQAQLDLVK